MKVRSLDHLVLTVKDIETTVEFYCSIMGMRKQVFGANRVALLFGDQKINLHQADNTFEPKAGCPQPGSADLCFVTEDNVDGFARELKDKNILILEGPVEKTGALGPILSIYFRDPDDNLIEVSNYIR